MVTLTVNGRTVQGQGDVTLLNFLRDTLRLTSVKNGCDQGACGSCTVVVDGRAVRACVPTLGTIEGRNVLTTEGLNSREKEVYAYAFAQEGAVQCGFCTPGMVMSAKALLDKVPCPTHDEIKKALRGNICRCTGYIKIEKAIQLAAQLLHSDEQIPTQNSSAILGESFHRVDSAEKTLGTGIYVDDIHLPNMLYASALRSAHPRARVLKIDTSSAQKHPDCVAVLTQKDVPGNNKIGHLSHVSDWDVLIAEGDVTRYVGDALALVVCRRKEALEQVKALVSVEYEVLAPLCSPVDAMAQNAPLIHDKSNNILKKEQLVRGDSHSAIAVAKHVVTQHYSLPFTEHAFLEPECAIAMPQQDGLLMYTAGQSIFDEQRECARMLGIPPEKIRVQSKLVGGGFGGKEDMSVQHHAALAAWCLKQPVKVLFSRSESIAVHPKRHAMEIDFTLSCDENGHLTALCAKIVSDTGAYASLGGPVLQRACTHAAGPYKVQNIHIEGVAVYTNNPPAGAFRGFGVCQSAFAMEQSLNLLAQKAGISPWEIRYRNAVGAGDVLANGQKVQGDCALKACLLSVKDAYESAPIAGIASFYKNSGIGVGAPDIGRCILSVEHGKIHLRTSAACIGQGLATVLTQIVCETLSLSPELITVDTPDTHHTPNSGTTTASRQTLFTGEATRLAALKLRDALSEGESLKSLNNREFLGEYSGHTDPFGSDEPHPISHVAYGYAAEVVALNQDGKIKKITAAYDMGRVINPRAAEGQIEGGIVMGLGYALTEDYPLNNGVPTARFGSLGLWRATQVPPMDIRFVQGETLSDAAYGAKGCGELATIPTAPAVAGAYYALDGILRTKLPMENTYYRKKK